MLGEEVVDLMRENPELPVRAMVHSEVCSGDYCSYWYAPKCRATIEEVVMEGEINNERLRVKGADWDDMIEQYADEIEYHYADIYFIKPEGMPGMFIDRCGDVIAYEEVEELAKKYINSLPWEKCIILWLDV